MNKNEISIVALCFSLLTIVLPNTIFWILAIFVGSGLIYLLRKNLNEDIINYNAYFFLGLTIASVVLFLFIFSLSHAAVFNMLFFSTATLLSLAKFNSLNIDGIDTSTYDFVQIDNERLLVTQENKKLVKEDDEIEAEKIVKKVLKDVNFENVLHELKREMLEEMNGVSSSINNQLANSTNSKGEIEKKYYEMKNEQFAEIHTKIDKLISVASENQPERNFEELQEQIAASMNGKTTILLEKILTEIYNNNETSTYDMAEIKSELSEMKHSTIQLTQLQNKYMYARKEKELREDEWENLIKEVHEVALEMKENAKDEKILYESIYVKSQHQYPYLTKKGISFLSTGEYLYQIHKGQDLDFAPIMIEFAKVIEVELNTFINNQTNSKSYSLGMLSHENNLGRFFNNREKNVYSFLNKVVEYRNGSAHTGVSTQKKVEEMRRLLFTEGWIKEINDIKQALKYKS